MLCKREMGSISSVPVVSQVKSLVQVIAGDEAGAKQTQEEFARTGILVSQFNSLGHAMVVSCRLPYLKEIFKKEKNRTAFLR